MSVAVSPYLPPTQGLGFSSGQQTDLLDALLASCQKATTNPRLPGYGRNLQPYFTSDTLNSQANSFVGVTKVKGQQKRSKGTTHSSSDSDEDSRLQSPVKGIQTQLIKSTSPPKTTSFHKQQKSAGAVVPVWAGPTFGIAPAASEIPTPSDFLLV